MDTYEFDFQWGWRECEPYPSMDEIAWYCTWTTHPVAELRPNPWGLYDVIGNVSEYTADHVCDDWCAANDHTCDDFVGCEPNEAYGEEPVTDPYYDYDGDTPGRDNRGCAWLDELEECRLTLGGALPPTSRNVAVGFRPARTRLDIGAEVEE
jgi:formylglycine-generating enzyme required for sulfatase activity